MKTKVEYIWIGGNKELRSKTRILDLNNNQMDINLIPEWNFDGSSTNQAEGNDSEVIIKPVRLYINPFTNGFLCLCDTYLPNGDPHITNTRKYAANIFNKYNVEIEKPMFGIEQEFFVINKNINRPLGFPPSDYLPEPQGKYYCSVGAGNCYGKEFLEECLDNCLTAGVSVTGSNMEVCPGQMEIQVCDYGLKAGDDNLILKYILLRTGEKYNYGIDFTSKPVKGDWNGSGCHTNFSTENMRNHSDVRYEFILSWLEKLRKKHKEHIEVYGSDNSERLTGLHETSSIDAFSYGVADRGASIRIPTSTHEKKCGYFEDRRPSSSADMYIVTSKIFETCLSN